MKRVIQKPEEEQQKASGSKRRERRTREQETVEPTKKNESDSPCYSNISLCCVKSE